VGWMDFYLPIFSSQVLFFFFCTLLIKAGRVGEGPRSREKPRCLPIRAPDGLPFGGEDR
jgi:hypothetical protein